MTAASQADDRRLRWIVFFGLALLVIVADQRRKMWIDANFELASFIRAGRRTDADHRRLRPHRQVVQHGGIFGLFGNSAIVLALASTVVIALIVVYEWREGIADPGC